MCVKILMSRSKVQIKRVSLNLFIMTPKLLWHNKIKLLVHVSIPSPVLPSIPPCVCSNYVWSINPILLEVGIPIGTNDFVAKVMCNMPGVGF